MIQRKKTKEVSIGSRSIGGNHPIAVQSMTNTKTHDAHATLQQINELAQVGCEIIRVSVPDTESAAALPEICTKSPIPVVADIHFDYMLALSALDAGIAKLRINPGNIGSMEHIQKVVKKTKKKKIPIRIGINSGSLERDILKKHHDTASAEALVESAMRHIEILEKLDFYDIIVSVKSSEIPTVLSAYKQLSKKISYPLHIGVTEAGPVRSGGIKSAIGIGALLAEGIGDTLRVSLSGDPKEEVILAWEILQHLDIRSRYRRFVSCPSCGRTKISLAQIATEIEEKTAHLPAGITIAVMGCEVNGPGEVAKADFGIIGGNKCVALFQKGTFLETIPEEKAVDRFLFLVNQVY